MLGVLVFLLLVINYPFIDSFLIDFFNEREEVFVERIIDGDTIEANGEKIRLLGINAPEKGEKYSDEAQQYLEDNILNKTVYLEYGKDKYDRYHRVLGYVFLGSRNINLELVEKGYANYYFPAGKDIHYSEFKLAWEECINNLCEKSTDKCANCIILDEFDYKNEIIKLKNICSFNCDLTGWWIKDEGRKIFIFPSKILDPGKKITIIVGQGEESSLVLYWERKTYVWTKTGDTLFLRDNNNGLVLWESY